MTASDCYQARMPQVEAPSTPTSTKTDKLAFGNGCAIQRGLGKGLVWPRPPLANANYRYISARQAGWMRPRNFYSPLACDDETAEQLGIWGTAT